jgi:hypothetical protein
MSARCVANIGSMVGSIIAATIASHIGAKNAASSHARAVHVLRCEKLAPSKKGGGAEHRRRDDVLGAHDGGARHTERAGSHLKPHTGSQ